MTRTITTMAVAATILASPPALAWTAKPATYDHASGRAACAIVEYGPGVNIAAIRIRQVDLFKLGIETAWLGVVPFERGEDRGRAYTHGTLYAAVDDRRFSDDDGLIDITPELLAALRSSTRLHLSWAPWSGDGPDQASANLDGFGEAYDACAADLDRILEREAGR